MHSDNLKSFTVALIDFPGIDCFLDLSYEVRYADNIRTIIMFCI